MCLPLSLIMDLRIAPPPSAGSAKAPFSLKDVSEEPLRPMTMVFCAVESGKVYAGWNRADAQIVHAELSALLRSILRQVPGGYLVRQQDGELRYLVAFSKPEVG